MSPGDIVVLFLIDDDTHHDGPLIVMVELAHILLLVLTPWEVRLFHRLCDQAYSGTFGSQRGAVDLVFQLELVPRARQAIFEGFLIHAQCSREKLLPEDRDLSGDFLELLGRNLHFHQLL